jgi:hypothetical protein
METTGTAAVVLDVQNRRLTSEELEDRFAKMTEAECRAVKRMYIANNQLGKRKCNGGKHTN